MKNLKIEKLSDDSLGSFCSGGELDPETKRSLMITGDVIMAAGLVSSAFTTIASTVCKSKGNEIARNAKSNEDLKTANKYFKTAEKLLIADGVLFGIGVLGVIPYCVGQYAKPKS